MQSLENLDSAPGNGAAWSAWPESEREPASEAACLEPPPPRPSPARVAERPENPSQQLGNLDSAPGTGAIAEASGGFAAHKPDEGFARRDPGHA